jgi:hypothetical protein
MRHYAVEGRGMKERGWCAGESNALLTPVARRMQMPNNWAKRVRTRMKPLRKLDGA